MRPLIFTALGVFLGCGPAPAARSPEAEPVTVLEAKVMDGPHASVAAFCKKLGAPACEAREDVLAPIMRDPVTTRSGVKIGVVAAATSDGKVQSGVLLLERAGEFWALPPVVSSPPGTKNAAATLSGFKHYDDADPDLVELTFSVSVPTQGSSHPDAVDGTELHDVCAVTAGKPIRCVRIVTGAVRDWPGSTKAEATARTGLLMIKGHTFDFLNIDQGPADPAFQGQVLKAGKYDLRFP